MLDYDFYLLSRAESNCDVGETQEMKCFCNVKIVAKEVLLNNIEEATNLLNHVGVHSKILV